MFNLINIEAYEPANPSVLLIILKDRSEQTTRDAKNIELVPAMLAWPTPQVQTCDKSFCMSHFVTKTYKLRKFITQQ